MSAPWGLHTVGRYTLRLVPPGERQWVAELGGFAEPWYGTAWDRQPTLEIYGAGVESPFGRPVARILLGDEAALIARTSVLRKLEGITEGPDEDEIAAIAAIADAVLS